MGVDGASSCVSAPLLTVGFGSLLFFLSLPAVVSVVEASMLPLFVSSKQCNAKERKRDFKLAVEIMVEAIKRVCSIARTHLKGQPDFLFHYSVETNCSLLMAAPLSLSLPSCDYALAWHYVMVAVHATAVLHMEEENAEEHHSHSREVDTDKAGGKEQESEESFCFCFSCPPFLPSTPHPCHLDGTE